MFLFVDGKFCWLKNWFEDDASLIITICSRQIRFSALVPVERIVYRMTQSSDYKDYNNNMLQCLNGLSDFHFSLFFLLIYFPNPKLDDPACAEADDPENPPPNGNPIPPLKDCDDAAASNVKKLIVPINFCFFNTI